MSLGSSIPTPPASSATPSHHPSPLPKPRKHSLRPGGPKESELIRYLDAHVNKIQKRCDDRFKNRRTYTAGADVTAGTGAPGHVEAYKSFFEAAKDMQDLIDVIWVSGSPHLQVPYLINMAVMISEFLPLFKPAPKATFKLLDKMDIAFSSLLNGTDPDTDDPLPGFENSFHLSTTHKVRLKGIVERTRLVVVKVMSGDNEGDEGEPMEGDEDVDMTGGEESDKDGEGYVKFEGFEDNDEVGDEGEGGKVEEEEWEEDMIGKVYERTIGELGDVLGGPPIGIVTDD